MPTTHGMVGTSTYKSWQAMKGRCSGRLSNPAYYSERGIAVCERWISFECFFEDMGVRPEGTTLDRIDNTKGYEPGNCKWSSKVEQMANRSNTVWLALNGERKTQAEWMRETGLTRGTIEKRIKRGWPIVDVLNPNKNFRYVKNGVLKATKTANKG